MLATLAEQQKKSAQRLEGAVPNGQMMELSDVGLDEDLLVLFNTSHSVSVQALALMIQIRRELGAIRGLLTPQPTEE